MPSAANAAIFAAALALAAGCGGSQGDADDTRSRPSAERAAPAERSDRAPVLCGSPPRAVARGGSAARLQRARLALARATTAAGARGHRFVTAARITSARGVAITARIEGRRTPDGRSEAVLAWDGPVGLALPAGTGRIVDDQLYARRAHHQEWLELGSASGISLDVGRELLAHPFLLEVVGAAWRGDELHVAAVAPAARLRHYAGTERRGPPSELLRSASSLRITASVRSGRLVGDAFVLRTRVPPGLGPRFAAGPVVVAASTGYCAPHGRRLPPIERPPTDRR